MNTVELIKVINNIPVKGEVCAKDLLPEKKPLDMKAYIVNTDISTDPGEQWVAIYFKRDQVIYFDSYGRPPEEQYVLPFIERNSSRWIHNKECLQSPWSKVCGIWCIYIIHQLNKGLDLNTAIIKNYMELEMIYTRMTEISRCGSSITMPESSYPRME